MVSKKIIGLGVTAVVVASIIGITLFLPKSPIRKLWIEDPSFDLVIDSPWSQIESGDLSDIEGNISSGRANFLILGETQDFVDISGVPNSSSSLGWQKFRNENFQYPQSAIINSSGLYVSHYWDEVEFGGINQTKNYPSVHFRNSIIVDVDMSDFIITEASLNVIFNASVGSNIDTPNDNYTGGQDEDIFAIGDFVTFYVLISDVNYSNSYTVGYNKTKYLGQYPTDPYLSILDSPLATVDELDLIRALNAAFEKDINHSEIIISLCIDIFSEDNDNSGDHDDWKALVINQCNLTFSYQKVINQFTTISFNQAGSKISGSTFQIVNSNLNFKYKTDKPWPTTAPLSELRLYINEKLYTEDIYKLSYMNSSFQEAKKGGVDVSNYLEEDINITLAFVLNLKDTFDLNETITISIDDIYLYIELREIEDDLIYAVYILFGSFTGLILFITIYEKYLKYPKVVRKVRKLRKNIYKNKRINKPIMIRKRTDIINIQFKEKAKIIDLELIKPSKPQVTKIKDSLNMKENERTEEAIK